jgi:crossover junction endodeoxyribonuclease RusA
MTIYLPYPPSINKYWRHVGFRTLISREGRRFRKHVIEILASLGCKPLQGPLAVKVEVYPPDNRRRDLDNILKALFDALGHGKAYYDDSQIVELHVKKYEVTPGGKVHVVLRQVEKGESDGNSRLDSDQCARSDSWQFPPDSN